jgi:hypothetical protein
MRCPRCCTAFIAAIAWLALSSCADAPVSAPSAPQPGVLVVSLETGAMPAGAVLVLVRGEGIGEPVAVTPDHEIFVRALDEAGAYRVAVVGDKVSGALFSFAVPDVNRPERYAFSLLEVADDGNGLRTDVADYRLSIAGRGTDASGVTIY